MTYHVRWGQSALNELSHIWLTAKPEARGAISDASGIIDRQLRQAPYAKSESREIGKRVMFSAPLGVRFHVNDDDQLVSVLHVWRFRLKSD